MRVVVLGSGTSMGVPVLGCSCRVCTSADPRDRRNRTAAIVEADDDRRILIDTPPELRLQLLAADVDSVDAVLFTHDHADHVHGIDDLRSLSLQDGELPVYGSPDALDRIEHRFNYIFNEQVIPPKGTSKPRLRLVPIEDGGQVTVAGMEIKSLTLPHGPTNVLAYRMGRFAYVTDVNAVPDEAVAALRGVDVLVLNALFEQPHPTHLSIPEAIDVARSIGADRTYLTHLTHRYSHDDLLKRLPDGIEPAYDGLTLIC